jgi:hypothetical protein
MSSTVVQSSDFNTSNISFSQVKILDNGGKQAYLNYGGRSLTMQTASMAVPYGMSIFDKQGPVKYSVDLSFRGYEDKSSKVAAFYNAMAQLDDFMIDQGVKNSQAWFKNKLTREVVEAFYTPVVRVSKDANGNPKPYPPSFKVALKKRNGSDTFDIQTYDDQKRPYEGVPLEDLLVKGAQVTVLVQCTGVWFAGSKYGLSWKAVQLRVDKLPESIRGFAFADEDGAVSAPAPARRAPVQQSQPVEEEEEVDDEEVFSAPAPAPAPTPAKKQSVLAAVAAPAPAPATLDDEAEDAEPIAVPKKQVVTKKKVVTTTKKA